jgi:hypothetical protein
MRDEKGALIYLGILVQAARQVPIIRRSDNAPFSTCLGCGAEDGMQCSPGCWVDELESALNRADNYLHREVEPA